MAVGRVQEEFPHEADMGKDSLGPGIKRIWFPRKQGELESNQHGLGKSRVQGLGLEAQPAAFRGNQAGPGEWDQSQAYLSQGQLTVKPPTWFHAGSI